MAGPCLQRGKLRSTGNTEELHFGSVVHQISCSSRGPVLLHQALAWQAAQGECCHQKLRTPKLGEVVRPPQDARP